MKCPFSKFIPYLHNTMWLRPMPISSLLLYLPYIAPNHLGFYSTFSEPKIRLLRGGNAGLSIEIRT